MIVEFPLHHDEDHNSMSKILVVDDEAIITMQLEERLSAMGYTVAGMAASGEEAVEKARRLLPDIVLMDIVMPGKMNGIEAAKIITDELDIPVVFVTSYADDAIIEKAKNVRPYGYIVKPFNELEIKAAIEVALFRKGTEQQIAKKGKKSEQEKIVTADAGQPEQDNLTYHDLPEIKTVLLKDIFTDIVLYLYTEHAAKEPTIQICPGRRDKKGRTQPVCLFPFNAPEILFKRDPETGPFHLPDKKKRSLYPVSGS